MGYTLGEAARATGLNKSSILKALKTGKISGAKDEHGQWAIEPCELHRVYPPCSEAPGADNGAGNDRHPPGNGPAPAVPDALVAELRAQLARMDRTLDDMREDRDRWRSMAERLALSPPKPSPAPPAETPTATPADAGGPLYRAWARWTRKAG
jgi:hypothetical protein